MEEQEKQINEKSFRFNKYMFKAISYTIQGAVIGMFLAFYSLKYINDIMFVIFVLGYMDTKDYNGNTPSYGKQIASNICTGLIFLGIAYILHLIFH